MDDGSICFASRRRGGIITDKGLAKHVGQRVFAEVRSGIGRRMRMLEGRGWLVKNDPLTYEGQNKFAIDPREEGKIRRNLVQNRTIVYLTSQTGRYYKLAYVSKS